MARGVRRRWFLAGAATWAACRPQGDEAAVERAASGASNPATAPSTPPSAVASAAVERSAPVVSSTAPAVEAEPPAPAVASSDAPSKKESRHHLTVPRVDVERGERRDYTVFGDGHSHPITIDIEAMAKLKAAGFALVQCGLGGPDKPHRHWVVVHVA